MNIGKKSSAMWVGFGTQLRALVIYVRQTILRISPKNIKLKKWRTETESY